MPIGSGFRRRGRVVQARACKALYMGSIPIVASRIDGRWEFPTGHRYSLARSPLPEGRHRARMVAI